MKGAPTIFRFSYCSQPLLREWWPLDRPAQALVLVLLCPSGQIRAPLSGYSTAAARAALPIAVSVCSIFLCRNNGAAASFCSATHSCQCVQYFLVSKQWCGCQCLQRYPFLSMCAVFSCVQTMVRLPVSGIFNVRTNVDVCDFTRWLHGNVREYAPGFSVGTFCPPSYPRPGLYFYLLCA